MTWTLDKPHKMACHWSVFYDPLHSLLSFFFFTLMLINIVFFFIVRSMFLQCLLYWSKYTQTVWRCPAVISITVPQQDGENMIRWVHHQTTSGVSHHLPYPCKQSGMDGNQWAPAWFLSNKESVGDLGSDRLLFTGWYTVFEAHTNISSSGLKHTLKQASATSWNSMCYQMFDLKESLIMRVTGLFGQLRWMTVPVRARVQAIGKVVFRRPEHEERGCRGWDDAWLAWQNMSKKKNLHMSASQKNLIAFFL